jgi:hypothetical protein
MRAKYIFCTVGIVVGFVLLGISPNAFSQVLFAHGPVDYRLVDTIRVTNAPGGTSRTSTEAFGITNDAAKWWNYQVKFYPSELYLIYQWFNYQWYPDTLRGYSAYGNYELDTTTDPLMTNIFSADPQYPHYHDANACLTHSGEVLFWALSPVYDATHLNVYYIKCVSQYAVGGETELGRNVTVINDLVYDDNTSLQNNYYLRNSLSHEIGHTGNLDETGDTWDLMYTDRYRVRLF